jgi:hypothetical protein
MKFAVLFTASGPIAILTSHESLTEPSLLEKFKSKGIAKFIAFQLPEDLARQRYGPRFDTVLKDVKESDDLRVLDFNGDRIFQLFRFSELGTPIHYEGEAASEAG